MWALGVVALLGVVFTGVLAMGQAVVTRHRAGSGADLAALAAAAESMRGGEEAAACARARKVAGAQGTRVVGCAVRGEVADVSVAAGVGPYEAVVRARAGPGKEAAADPATDSAPARPAI